MEVLNIILGAVIAMLSSVVTTIILVRNQHIETETKRKWEVEDKNINEQKVIVLSRLQQIEDYAEDIAKSIIAVKSAIVSYEQDCDVSKLDLKNVRPLFSNAYLNGVIGAYGDDELVELFNQLLTHLETAVANLIILKNKKDKGEGVEDVQLADINYLGAFTKIITKIDQLKINIPEIYVKSSKK